MRVNLPCRPPAWVRLPRWPLISPLSLSSRLGGDYLVHLFLYFWLCQRPLNDFEQLSSLRMVQRSDVVAASGAPVDVQRLRFT